VANERAALINLNCGASQNTGVQVYAFEADDQTWKGSDVERSFGIFGKITLNGDVFNNC
jgi:exo-beta-1,3-glucanase (GH17 family)